MSRRFFRLFVFRLFVALLEDEKGPVDPESLGRVD